jgi:hypothetical protein
MTWQPDLFPPVDYHDNWPHTYATNVAEADEAEEMHSKPSQRDAILRHLKENPYHPITHLEAQHLFGCSRLAARVQELRRMGHDVKSRMVETPSGKRVAEYWLGGLA